MMFTTPISDFHMGSGKLVVDPAAPSQGSSRRIAAEVTIL